MANKAGLGVIEFGDTPTAVAEVRSYSAPGEAPEIDTTVMGTGYASSVPGNIATSLEAELFFEYGDPGQALILGQLGNDVAQDLALFPQGKATGLPQLTGKATVRSFTTSGAADGAIELTVNFGGDGANPLVWSAQP